MNYALLAKRLLAGFAVVAALGGVAMANETIASTAVDSFNQVASVQVKTPTAQYIMASRSCLHGFAKATSAVEKEKDRLHAIFPRTHDEYPLQPLKNLFS